MTANTVIVFAPDGTPERHTRANARDLVNGAGYTWQKGRPTTPASIAPFAVFKSPEGTHPAQQVLNKATGGSPDGKSGASSAAESALAQQQALMEQLAAQQNTATAPIVEEVVDFSAPVAEAADAEVEALMDAEEPADETPAPAPTGRGRRRAS